MKSDRSDWLDLAISAVRDAGLFLNKSGGKGVTVTSEEGRDIKLALDRDSEERILTLLSKQSDFPVLSEEMGKTWNPDLFPDYHWIVDPLDGSLNYSRAVPLCCVSIGLWRGNKPILGAIYDFNRDEMFSGIVGDGSWINGIPIKVNNVSAREKAVLCTGFPVSTDFSDAGIRQFMAFVRDYKKIRLFGTAALSLAYVASGRVDAYCERDIKIWDVAAGLAIVEAAGGNNHRLPSLAPNCLTVFSANRSLSGQDLK